MPLLYVLASLVLVACSSGPEIGDSQEIPGEEPLASIEVEPDSTLQSSLLARGKFSLPAANAFGEPGFHEKVLIEDQIDSDVKSTSGWTLSILLFDLGRPAQLCTQEHPLSGCATVDWSDAEDRPKVPEGGVFENSLKLELSSGVQVFYLSESGNLEAGPDAFDPG